MKGWLVAAAIVALTGSAADAALTKLTVDGRITRSVALNVGGDYVPLPAGSIAVGDAYHLEAVFNPDLATVSPTFDADPAINIYYLRGTTVTVTIGLYSKTFIPRFDFNSSVQIWNNYSNGLTDSQSFSFFNYDVDSSSVPFQMGIGRLSESFDFNEFDRTGTARSNDLLPLTQLSSYANKTLSYSILNADSKLFVLNDAVVTSASLSVLAPVPEPATWAMFIGGFGLIGSAMRRRGLKGVAA